MKFRYRVLGFLFAFAVITFVDRVCIALTATAMQADLSISARQWGWMLGLFSLAYGAFEMPIGALADRWGPRRVLGRIITCWSVFTILTGFVTRYWQLLIVRFLFGVGEAGAFPGCTAVIQRWFPVHERARAQGVVFMASRIGAALAPFVVLPILHSFGWRACFVVCGVAGLLWPLLWYRWFRDTPGEKAGISDAERTEIGSSPAGDEPVHLGWRAVLKRPVVRWMMGMYFLCCWTTFFYLGWLHTFLEHGRGFGRTDLLAWSWVPFVFGAGANLLGGWTCDQLVGRFGLRAGRCIVGAGGMGASALCIVAAYLVREPFWTIFWLALGYAGSDFMLPAAWAACLDIGGRQAGLVSGAMNMAGQAGAFATSVVFGYLVSWTGDWNVPLIPMAVCTALGALAWLRIDPSEKLSENPQNQE